MSNGNNKRVEELKDLLGTHWIKAFDAMEIATPPPVSKPSTQGNLGFSIKRIEPEPITVRINRIPLSTTVLEKIAHSEEKTGARYDEHSLDELTKTFLEQYVTAVARGKIKMFEAFSEINTGIQF